MFPASVLFRSFLFRLVRFGLTECDLDDEAGDCNTSGVSGIKDGSGRKPDKPALSKTAGMSGKEGTRRLALCCLPSPHYRLITANRDPAVLQRA